MCRVQLPEPPLGHAGNGVELARRPPAEEALRFLGLERPDHRTTRYNARRYMSSETGASRRSRVAVAAQ